ncbi:MAG: SPFH domain-containing protein [Chloroflexi bacterium]|nr:MAG: SPFH domain-containing protein [Chloroflexota bacterium]
MANIRNTIRTVAELAQSDEVEQFAIDARDFFSARQDGEKAGTQIAQISASIDEVAEIINRSRMRDDGAGEQTNIISPVVMPKSSGSYARALGWPFILTMIGLIGWFSGNLIDGLFDGNISAALFGFHYWVLVVLVAAFGIVKNRYVMVPDGCQALVTKFGKVEEVVGAGRKWLGFHPRRKVGYIVNVTKQYPYNAPIREAPTEGRVNASVDLFLQFRIEDSQSFIFTLGGVNGFSEKLHHAISEVTRALIYEQRAEQIYDLVGESTQSLLETLNNQFLPAVRFVNANITHAEPSSREYRMDLASPEMVKVAKEAYTEQYKLSLRKSQDEGELNKELASLRETLSEISADIATHQAQMDTAHEKAINQANAYSQQLLIEAESEARANSSLLEAQALDIQTVNSAFFHEILEYRYQQEVLDRIKGVAGKLPQVVNLGPSDNNQVDFMAVAQQMMGVKGDPLYTAEDIKSMRKRTRDIVARIKDRAEQLDDEEAAEAVAIAEELDDTPESKRNGGEKTEE